MFTKRRKDDQDVTNPAYMPLSQNEADMQAQSPSQRMEGRHVSSQAAFPIAHDVYIAPQINSSSQNSMKDVSMPQTAPMSPLQTGIPTQKAPTKKRTVIIALLSILIAVIIWLLIWLFACNGSDLFDSSAQTGQAPYKSEEEIQAELNRTVDEGMFNISIASAIQFQNGTSTGTAYIENVPGNRYYMQVTITDDDTGDVLYESGVLKPNQYIEDITLTKDLDAGMYDATATFKAMELDTMEEVGTAAAKLTISVAS